jgi:ammonium transporter, Amt family
VFASAAINGAKGLVEGDAHQLGIQVLAVGITGAYAFVISFGILKVLNFFGPVRVSEEHEMGGLDQLLHGEAAYDLA